MDRNRVGLGVEQGVQMDLTISLAAVEFIRRKGGTMALDLLMPIS